MDLVFKIFVKRYNCTMFKAVTNAPHETCWKNRLHHRNKFELTQQHMRTKQGCRRADPSPETEKNILNLFLHNRDSVIIEQLLYSNLLPVEKPERQLRKNMSTKMRRQIINKH